MFLWKQIQYVQFHNLKFKMPECHLLIGLETRFKLIESSEFHHLFSIKSIIWCYPLPLAYGLYACENINHYGWPLTTYLTIFVSLWSMHNSQISNTMWPKQLAKYVSTPLRFVKGLLVLFFMIHSYFYLYFLLYTTMNSDMKTA